eukprot:m.171555 g.171555  ORF g.171555 m.171555 type:complete len:772 (+) comp17276_c0_seq3:78-2393(+)
MPWKQRPPSMAVAASGGVGGAARLRQDDVVVNMERQPPAVGYVVSVEETTASSEDTVHVCYPFCGVTIPSPSSKLKLIDRPISHGMYVQRCKRGRGLVDGIGVFVDVKLLGENACMSFDASKIRPIRDFYAGAVVTCGPWVGVVTDAQETLAVHFSCGIKLWIPPNLAEFIVPNDRFHVPGETIVIMSKALPHCIWVEGIPARRAQDIRSGIKCTIDHIAVNEVGVRWITSAIPGSPRPPTMFSGDNLKQLYSLHSFYASSLRVGERALLAATADGTPLPQPLLYLDSSNARGVEIVRTRTSASLLYQSGQRDDSISSLELRELNYEGEHEFWPGDPVMRVDAVDDVRGIVQEVYAHNRTCKVHWFPAGYLRNQLPSSGASAAAASAGKTEEVSVYELACDASLALKVADYVIWAAPPSAARSVYQLAGEVMHVSLDGTARVHWADHTETCAPLGCFRVIDVVAENDGPQSAEFSISDGTGSTGYGGGEPAPRRKKNFLCRAFQSLINANLASAYSNSRLIMSDDPPANHRFIDRMVSHCPTALARCLKAEMRAFEELPKDITVYGYMNRTDLFRAVIYGQPDSLYEGAAFVFDIHLPPNYPQEPPRFLYVPIISSKLNPSLHAEDGKVCISLLNTVDNPALCSWSKSCNITQVLVAIQAMVLTNNPQYDTHGSCCPDDERMFNEEVLLAVLQSMTVCLRSPPPLGMEAQIAKYVRVAAANVLDRVENALENKPVKVEYPLLPFAQGCMPVLRSRVATLRALLAATSPSSS